METFGKLILVFIGGLINGALGGFVLSKLWLWFVVASLGWNSITVLQAIGLMYVGSIFQHINPDEPTKGDPVSNFVFSLTRYSLLLLFGWIVTLFM